MPEAGVSEPRLVVGADYRDLLTVQDYSPKPRIEGVQLLDLRLFVDDGGSFNELVRVLDDNTIEALPSFRIRQASYSEVMPGSIKAWHLHKVQEDLWFVPPSQRLLVGLLDVRVGSVTQKQSMRFVLGGGTTRLLYIPAGVAHGAANPWQAPTAMFYFTSSHFDAATPDEHRLPWDVIGADFWTMQAG